MPRSIEPSASWPFAANTFLDRGAVIDALRRLAAELARTDARVQRVVLFGSMATGRATIRSDADLLIVLESHPATPRDRIPEYLRAFLDGPVPVDVIPLTAGEIKVRRGSGDRFLAKIEAEGVPLFP